MYRNSTENDTSKSHSLTLTHVACCDVAFNLLCSVLACSGFFVLLVFFLMGSALLTFQEEISSPISAQILEFCDPELFPPETLQNSEVASCSNCCYEQESYATNLSSMPPDMESQFNNNNNNSSSHDSNSNNTATRNATATTPAPNPCIIFDSQDDIDNDISASIDFSPSPSFSVPPYLHHDQQLDFSALHHQIQVPGISGEAATAAGAVLPQYPADHVVPLVGPPLLPVFEEDCLTSMPTYLGRLNPASPSCSFLDPSMAPYLPHGGCQNHALSAESSAMFSAGGAMLLGPDHLQGQELEYQQGDSVGMYCTDTMQRVFNTGDLQALSNESQQLVSGGGGSSTATLASEITSLEDSAFKVGKLSVEQRKEKIHRYMKKRNERNFSKKIKYACRKTLADSRPRVRGRFAKNDDFGENPRPTCSSNHEEEDDEEVVVKEEDDMVDSADIFAHISGVNSFKCSYPIQSWI